MKNTRVRDKKGIYNARVAKLNDNDLYRLENDTCLYPTYWKKIDENYTIEIEWDGNWVKCKEDNVHSVHIPNFQEPKTTDEL